MTPTESQDPRSVVTKAITSYSSTRIPERERAIIAPFVTAALADFKPDTSREARTLSVVLTRHVYWCWQRGYPVDRQVVFRREVIAESVGRGMGEFTKKTQATYRSRLHALSNRLLTGPYRPPILPTIGAQPAQAPYSAAEIAVLCSWAAGQSTDYRRVNATLLLALGFGAGLSTAEVVGLRCGDVTVDDEGVLVAVGGTRSRVVPVRADWEGTVAEVARAAMRPEQWLFLPRRAGDGSRNLLNGFVRKTNDKPFEVRIARLRATWIVDHLIAGTPAALLARAAGLESPQALGRYIPFVPDADPVTERRRLRAVAVRAGVSWSDGRPGDSGYRPHRPEVSK